MAQNTGDVISFGKIPWYSVEKPNIGATVEYAGMNAIQISMDPGIAMTVYLVHKFVTKAAFPSTVASTAVYNAVPHSQCPAT